MIQRHHKLSQTINLSVGRNSDIIYNGLSDRQASDETIEWTDNNISECQSETMCNYWPQTA